METIDQEFSKFPRAIIERKPPTQTRDEARLKLVRLTEREREVLRLYFLKGKTLGQIGKKMERLANYTDKKKGEKGLTATRVRHIKERGIRKLAFPANECTFFKFDNKDLRNAILKERIEILTAQLSVYTREYNNGN